MSIAKSRVLFGFEFLDFAFGSSRLHLLSKPQLVRIDPVVAFTQKNASLLAKKYQTLPKNWGFSQPLKLFLRFIRYNRLYQQNFSAGQIKEEAFTKEPIENLWLFLSITSLEPISGLHFNLRFLTSS
jgi:hypothetical protein